MTRTIGRRDFIKTGAGAGLTLAMGKALLAASGAAPMTKPSVVGVGIGEDYGQAAGKAIALAGGMKAFVQEGLEGRPARERPEPSSGHATPSRRSSGPSSGLCKKVGAARDRLSELADGQAVGGHRAQARSSTKTGAGLKIFEKDESALQGRPRPRRTGPSRGPDPGRALRPRRPRQYAHHQGPRRQQVHRDT